MGAAASMQHVYSDAMDWFKMVSLSVPFSPSPLTNSASLVQYFDRVAYMEDFRALDVNGDGGEKSFVAAPKSICSHKIFVPFQPFPSPTFEFGWARKPWMVPFGALYPPMTQ